MSTSRSLIRRLRVRRSAEQWRDIIHRFEQSGQTREAFCADHSLALSTFSRWRQRLRALSSPHRELHEAAAFVEISAPDGALTAAPSEPWDIELQLGADIILRLRRSC